MTNRNPARDRPGGVRAGDICALLTRFSALKQKALARTGKLFPIVVIQEAGLDGFFRHFDNRRQVASYAGLAPTPWQSGSIDREQGVSKSGNPRLRATLIELAWLWVRHQPKSALTLWFEGRVKRNDGRHKKSTIVALARKLLVALWKYVTAGVVIEGAVMKTPR